MAFLTESKRHRPLHRRRRGPRPGVPGQRLCAEQEQLIRPPGLFNALDLDSSHPLLIDHLVVHPLEIAASVYLLEPRVEILEAEIGLRATAQIDAGHFGQLAFQDLWVHTQAMGHDTDFLHRRHRRRSGGHRSLPGLVVNWAKERHLQSSCPFRKVEQYFESMLPNVYLLALVFFDLSVVISVFMINNN
jgi:hypothetical protein